MPPEPFPSSVSNRGATGPFRARDWLIAFLLVLASIQTVRADFFVNDSFLDWRQYALGHAPLPYQGRAALVPVLRWAGDNEKFRRLAARYAVTVKIGTIYYEPITPEKFMSLLLGLASVTALMGTGFWWARRRRLALWWLPDFLILFILAVTVALRATTNYWYAYDLPHAALFGVGAILAIESYWPLALCCFALDVPLRETSLFSIVMLLPVFFVQGAHLFRRSQLDGQLTSPGMTLSPSFVLSPANRPALFRTAALGAGMSIVWIAVRVLISHHYAGNTNETYPRTGQNLHELLLPHHWPQLFSAGGYLALPVLLSRDRLGITERALLWGCVACVPITLWFGVWTETRVWMEWTLPLAALASLELLAWLQTNPFLRLAPAR